MHKLYYLMYERISRGQMPMIEKINGIEMCSYFYGVPVEKWRNQSINSIKMSADADGNITCWNTGSQTYKKMDEEEVRHFWQQHFLDENKYG